MTRGAGTPSWMTGVAPAAAVMTAYHVSARATRDALFLTAFDFSWLPWMSAGASVLSILAAVGASRRLHAHGPGRFVAIAFLASAVLTLLEFWLLARRPGWGTIAFFTHVTVLGPVLVSAFWLLASDDVDPRTMRRNFGRTSALATLGGLVGCVVIERTTAWFGLAAALPILAAAHLVVAGLAAARSRSRRVRSQPVRSAADPGARPLFASRHRRVLALIVLGCSISASLLDFVFKAQTDATAGSELGLVRVFLGFNGIVVLGTVLLQLFFTRLGSGRGTFLKTVGTVPAAVLLGGTAAVMFPAAWLVATVRGLEAVLRGSLFRSGYEVLYAGIARQRRLSFRILVDVGCDRLGDIVAAGMASFVLATLPVGTSGILLVLAATLAGATLVLVPRLEAGHRRALEASLRPRGGIAGVPPPSGPTPWVSLGYATGGLDEGPGDDEADAPVPVPPPAGDASQESRSITARDPERPRQSGILRGGDEVEVAEWIRRLGSSESTDEARDALLARSARHVGQLVDALLDPDTPTRARVQIAVILGACLDGRAVDGLSLGLADESFEVRGECGRSLARLLRRDGRLRVDSERVYEAVMREANFVRHDRATRGIGGPHRTGSLDAFLEQRTEQAVDHIFRLIVLELPGEATEHALRHLRADDPVARGTALEYMDGVLPPAVREAVWFVLEDLG